VSQLTGSTGRVYFNVPVCLFWEDLSVQLLENPSASIDVLIAEDDPDVRRAVRHVLECEGYTCAEAEDGQEALAIALQCPPRLVLLDLMMPGMDGFTTAENLRANPVTSNVHIH